MLKRKLIMIGLAAVLIIAIIGGYLSLSYYIDHPSLEQVRDMTIAYIKAHHKETGQYMQSFSWTGKDITPEGWTGGAIYSYQSAGWNITLQHATGLPPSIWSPTFYSMTATFTSQVSRKVIASWQGKLDNGMITETSYKYSP